MALRSKDMKQIKLCLLGDIGVGKTNIVIRFVSDTFEANHKNTIGVAFQSRTVKIDGEIIQFHIWDTAGQEKYKALTPIYYRRAAAVIVVYDITSENSVLCMKRWVEELTQAGPKDLLLAVAGNKCDLEDKRQGNFVGKSNIVLRFADNRFDPALQSTIGFTSTRKSIDVNGETITFQVCDTAGHERFKSIVKQYYRGAAAAIAVYDITSKESFKDMKSWVVELTRFEPNAILAVAGNKCDLKDIREVSLEEGKQYADHVNAIFNETSAKTAQNIDELFLEIGKALSPKVIALPKEPLLDLHESTKGKKRLSCCK